MQNLGLADNQQERLEMIDLQKIPPSIGYYLAGFADGEGSFNISFRPRNDYTLPWKVSACFNISQKDKVILALCKRHFQCGTLRSRPDGVWYFEVNNINALKDNIIPFFKRFRFLSAKKKRDFSKFLQIVEIIDRNEHLHEVGIKTILAIRHDMNDGGNRRYSDEEILRAFKNPQRLYAKSPSDGGE